MRSFRNWVLTLAPERSQLLEFLSTSLYYKSADMMTLFASVEGRFDTWFLMSGLEEEQAILLGRLARHEKALQLYVKMSPEKADAHCARYAASDPSVYLCLLKVILPRLCS